jgi:UDP-N-acetylmuramoyl-tripeptide--D-alanyl-D-alanine ligase
MIPMTLQEIADAVGGRLAPGADPGTVVTGPASIDSREIAAGALFAALPGEHVDGHEFAAAAVAAGAVAVLAARPIDGLPGGPVVLVADVVIALGALARTVAARVGAVVVGVTGSSGKTSTKDLMAQVLAPLGGVVATARSFNNEIGLPLTVLRADENTRVLVLEMGARGVGHLAYLCGLVPPTVGAVINVGTAHVGEYPGGREQIAVAKGELVECLPPAGSGGLAVLNADDPLVAAMAGRTAARVLWWGRDGARCDVHASEVRLNGHGQPRFLLHTPGGSAPVALQLTGEHHVGNALAAAAVAYGLGLGVEVIAAGLSGARRLSAGRMEVTTRRDGVIVINDAFNANTDSTKAALATLVAMAGRRTVAVLGEMAELGDDAAAAHQEIGALAARLNVTKLIAVGGELAGLLAAAARDAHAGLDVTVVADAASAEGLLRRQLRTGDVVLVKASHSAHLDELATRLSADPAPAEASTR